MTASQLNLPTDQAIQTAFQLHQSARLAEAEAIYRRILAQQPDHARALHLLGVIALQMGRFDAAEQLIARAIATGACDADYFANYGMALAEQRKFDRAIAAYRQCLAIRPESPLTLNNLGNCLNEVGTFDAAMAAFREAIRLNPAVPEFHFNVDRALDKHQHLAAAIDAYREAVRLRPDHFVALQQLAIALTHREQWNEAIAAFQKCIALRPDSFEIWTNLGKALAGKGERPEACKSCQRAIRLNPNCAELHSNLGIVLAEAGQLEQAIIAFDQALALKPQFPEAITSRGSALMQQGRLDEATAAFRIALSMKPDYAEVHHALGRAWRARGLIAAARAAFDDALRIEPDFPEAHWGLGEIFLLQDDSARGWDEYEWRLRTREFAVVTRRFHQPRWNGQSLAGKTILLHPDQGFGDTIQFLRYVPFVRHAAGGFLLECRPEMARLARSLGVELVVGDQIPPFDLQCPLGSLPLALRNDLPEIPVRVPYLAVESDLIASWKERLGPESQHVRVGLAWAGNANHKNDRSRSIRFAQVAPLVNLPDVVFYSLQKQTRAPGGERDGGVQWIDFTGEIYDFADTAALMQNLDLVITVDTSVAHLAGALGKPVWILLPCAPDWRWQLDRDDSIWYPTARLFRQRQAGDWDEVVARVRRELNVCAGALVERRKRS